MIFPARPLRRLALALTFLIILSATPAAAYLYVIHEGRDSAGVPGDDDNFGWALVVGDFDNDGLDDLATGSPGNDTEGPEDGEQQGAVIVSYGGFYGLVRENADLLTPPPTGDPFARFGHALAVGRFNDDPFDDLAVGAPYHDITGLEGSGLVFIFYGSANGLGGDPVVFDQQDAGGAIEIDDLFGHALAAGDFDGDGLDDLAVAAVGENISRGAVSFFSGSAGGLQTGGSTVTAADLLSPGSSNDAFGYALATGNVRDTFEDDLIIGVPFWDNLPAGAPDGGRVFTLAGGPGGLIVTSAEITTPEDIGLTGSEGAEFGRAVAAGWLQSAGGLADMVIGEPGYATSGLSFAGRAVVSRAGTVTVLDQTDTADDQPDTGDRFGMSLTVGDFTGDGQDDLFVGAPFDDMPEDAEPAENVVDAGVAHVFIGAGAAFPLAEATFHADKLNGFFEVGANFGHALAAGRFADHWDQDFLAVGTPFAAFHDFPAEEDNECREGLVCPENDCDPTFDAGVVQLAANGVGVYSLRASSAAALNCQGELVFAVRAFDPVRPASTTKLMSMLVANDAVDDQEVALDSTWDVPPYISDCVRGSQYGLADSDLVEFETLLRMMMMKSANEAAYLIADIVNGYQNIYDSSCDVGRCGVPSTVLGFLDRMNQKAGDIGMSSDTMFLSPAGRDMTWEDDKHRATAYDMALLGAEAMLQPLVRDIVGTESWEVWRTQLYQDGGANWNEWLDFGWLTDAKGYDPEDRVIGIKSGGTKYGGKCGIWAGQELMEFAPAIATVYGATSRSWSHKKGVAQVSFALSTSSCGTSPAVPGQEPPPRPLLVHGGISTLAGEKTGATTETRLDEVLELAAEVRLTQSVLGATHHVVHQLTHHLGLEIPALEQATLQVDGYDGHRGILVRNDGPGPLDLQITTSEPDQGPYDLTLDAGEPFEMVADTTAVGSMFTLTLLNGSRFTAALEITATYEFDIALTATPPGDAHVAVLSRDRPVYHESLASLICGLDGADAGEVYLSYHDPDGATAVADERPQDAMPTSRLGDVRAFPNPFNAHVSFEYQLNVSGPVRIEIHDLRGRRVRVLETDPNRDAGRHRIQWDGRDGLGRSLASGRYVCRITSGSAVRTLAVALVK